MTIWKPKIIDRYIIMKFIVSFFVAMLLIIGVVIIFDLSEKIDDFVKYEAPIKAIIFDYYLNYIPYFVNMFSPLFVFITVIFFNSKMAANSEIIAILSGGISFHRMMVPHIISALIIALLSLALNLFVIPRANATRVEFDSKYNGYYRGDQSFSSTNFHSQISPGEFVYVNSFSKWNKTAYNFTLEKIENNKLVSKITAETAVWDSTTESWHLKNYFIRDYSEGLNDVVVSGERKDTTIQLKIADFYMNKKTVETLSIKDLNKLIDTQKGRGDENVMFSLMEKHRRMTLPFSSFILTIMGVALTSKKKRGGIGWNLAVGIALAFLYILFLRFSEMFVYTGTLPAAVALWLPNFVYTIIAIVLYRMAPK